RRVGAHQGEAPVGVLRSAGPDLLPVDQEVVALVLGARLQAGEVRTRTRLGVALAPAGLAAADRRDVPLLLLFRAELQQRRAQHPHAHRPADRIPPARLADFLSQHARLLRTQPAAAVFLGPRRRAPAAAAQLRLPGLDLLALGVRLARLWRPPAQRLREGPVQP